MICENDKKNKYKSNPNEISLNNLKEILDVLALIESKGKYFKETVRDNEHISMKQVRIFFLTFIIRNQIGGEQRKPLKLYSMHSRFSKLQRK